MWTTYCYLRISKKIFIDLYIKQYDTKIILGKKSIFQATNNMKYYRRSINNLRKSKPQDIEGIS